MSLTLYIYLCEIVGNFDVALSFVFRGGLLSMLICLVTYAVSSDFNQFKRGEELCEAKVKQKNILGCAKIFAICSVSSLAVSVVVPSKNTMYAMAAAYYGEQAVKSETFQKLNSKAMQLLEVKIDELIGDKKK